MKFIAALYLVIFCSASSAQELSVRPFEECIVLPIRVHLLASINNSDANTTLQESDIQRIFAKAGRIWLQAGILLLVESIVHEPISETNFVREPLTSTRTQLFSLRRTTNIRADLLNVYYLHAFDVNGICFPDAIFVKDTAALRKVPGGINEPIPRVTSHEIGHALGLDHRQNVTNLMASGTTGIWLNASEQALARGAAQVRVKDFKPDFQSARSQYDRAIKGIK